jgi:hypothetical protein
MASVDDELSQIERDIRTLKIEFEQYFGGGRKRPPSDTQWRLDSLIRRCAERMADLNYGQRFRYNNLTQTYAKYQDMWRKKTIQKETGATQHHFGAAAKAIEAERRAANPMHGHQDHSASEHGAPHHAASQDENRAGSQAASHAGRVPVFALTCSVAAEREKIEILYHKLIQARKETGEQAGAPSLKDFEEFLQRKMRGLQQKGAHHVEYTVTLERGHVKLKARIAD